MQRMLIYVHGSRCLVTATKPIQQWCSKELEQKLRPRWVFFCYFSLHCTIIYWLLHIVLSVLTFIENNITFSYSFFFRSHRWRRSTKARSTRFGQKVYMMRVGWSMPSCQKSFGTRSRVNEEKKSKRTTTKQQQQYNNENLNTLFFHTCSLTKKQKKYITKKKVWEDFVKNERWFPLLAPSPI